MYADKKPTVRKPKTRTFIFSRFKGIDTEPYNDLPADYAKYATGFSMGTGRLKNSYGFSQHALIRNPKYSKLPITPLGMSLTYITDYPFQMVFDRYAIYMYNSMTHYWTHFDQVENCLKIIDYTKNGVPMVLVISIKQLRLYHCIKNNNIVLDEEVTTTFDVRDCCYHYTRMFAVDYKITNRIHFSAPLSLSNWNHSLTEGGYIDIDAVYGQALKLFSLGENVIIFAEHAIYKLTAYADQTQFNLKLMHVSSEKINGSAITAADGKIIFLLESGLYAVNAHDVYPYRDEFNHYFIGCMQVKAKKPIMLYLNGKLYISYRSNIGAPFIGEHNTLTEWKRDTLFVIDTASKEHDFVKGVEIDVFGVMDTNKGDIAAVGVTNLKDGFVGDCRAYPIRRDIPVPGSTARRWESHIIDCGMPNADKNLKHIDILTKSLLDVYVKANGRSIRYRAGADKTRVNIGLKVKSFQLILECFDGVVDIPPPRVTVEFLEE